MLCDSEEVCLPPSPYQPRCAYPLSHRIRQGVSGPGATKARLKGKQPLAVLLLGDEGDRVRKALPVDRSPCLQQRQGEAAGAIEEDDLAPVAPGHQPLFELACEADMASAQAVWMPCVKKSRGRSWPPEP